MSKSLYIKQAKEILTKARNNSTTAKDRCEQAINLAALILQEANHRQTFSEKKQQAQLARMMHDPKGKAFTTAMTDQSFRSNRSSRIADQIVFNLQEFGIPHYPSFSKKLGLWTFYYLGKMIPNVLVPIVKALIRKETSSVILPGEEKELLKHIKKRQQEKVHINLNRLGEAILGEEEAKHRLQIYLNDLNHPEIEYISIKISTICSQISLLGWEKTLKILTTRLKTLYRTAQNNFFTHPNGSKSPKFINLDMEEYKDLHLTIEAFKIALEDPEFKTLSAGIVLQAYLPDVHLLQKQLTLWAKERIAKGGAPIKIRIVKGANLSMEKVEASLKGWPQAPYTKKIDVDANFKKMLHFGFLKENAEAVHLGVATHNLFDAAYALILREENQIQPFISFEMLEGMADHLRRVVQEISLDMLLYCPAATKEEFQNAIAYLVRRLDENTAPDNFLTHTFKLQPNSKEWNKQADLFKESVDKIDVVLTNPQRTQDRSKEDSFHIFSPESDSVFYNEPDTDWSLIQNRKWAESILSTWKEKKIEDIPLVIAEKSYTKQHTATGEDPSKPGNILYRYSLAEIEDLEKALSYSKKEEEKWAQTSIIERNALFAKIANNLRTHRKDLIGAMLVDTGKTIIEADTEVSEAIDFAEYYRHNLKELQFITDIHWKPKGTLLIASPWNFPCSIPSGGILAALAAGNCVIFKPAPEAVLVGWTLVNLFWEAGISKSILQFVTCEDEPTGSFLIKNSLIDAVILTGATSTAKHFLHLRPGLDLMAETGGKNAMIITSMADRDLAIKELIQSAFGYSGQKCSACSLAILEKEVYEDLSFLQHLKDAAESLQVGSPWDLNTKINPLIHAPNPTLMKGLTTLENGETWLLTPKQIGDNPNLWSPGIKLGVKPDSFTFQNELFGPVLGLVCALDLEHAINLANSTNYGLTSGIQSLDEREQDLWIKKIEAGNCYINRSITGAIVQRQPFGGCKESSFGPGSKAGGPNYLIQMFHREQLSLPNHGQQNFPYPLQVLSKYLRAKEATQEEEEIWRASVSSYLIFWKKYFSGEHDPSQLIGQDNLLCYKPHDHIVVYVQPKDSLLDLLRVVAALLITGTSFEIEGEHETITELTQLKIPARKVIEEQFIKEIHSGRIKRVRLLSKCSDRLLDSFAQETTNLHSSKVLPNGRIELLNYLREIVFSIDYHRYGNLGKRENEKRIPYFNASIGCTSDNCSSCKCK